MNRRPPSALLDAELLEESFDLVSPRAGELVDTFYNTVFSLCPSARVHFQHVDMAQQNAKFISTLMLLRSCLRDLSTFVPTMNKLGAQHAGYGADPYLYAVFGRALRYAMADIAGPKWKPSYDRAWTEVYQLVQDVMLEAGREAKFLSKN